MSWNRKNQLKELKWKKAMLLGEWRYESHLHPSSNHFWEVAIITIKCVPNWESIPRIKRQFHAWKSSYTMSNLSRVVFVHFSKNSYKIGVWLEIWHVFGELRINFLKAYVSSVLQASCSVWRSRHHRILRPIFLIYTQLVGK